MSKPGADFAEAAHEIEVKSLKDRLATLNEKYKGILAKLQESDDRLAAVLRLKEKIGDHPPTQIKIHASGRTGESTAVVEASDWHLEEKVDPLTVEGVNEFTPEIATRRAKNFFERTVSMVDMLRTRSRIESLVLWLGGDLVSGYIHDELMESNYLSPTEAIFKAFRLLTGGIDFLLEHGGFKKIAIPCNFGNHGRTTKKRRVSTAAKNSYEWLLYQFLRERYADEPRLTWQIADGYFNYFTIYGTKLRSHHGDAVKYQGGVGGVDIPLNKAIAQWNKMKPVDIDLLGHWHQRKSQNNYALNGSLIGYNAYAVEIKAAYEPPSQSLFLVHPEWGKTVEIPVFLD